MADETPLPSNGNFTNKEMWVRVDGKLDVVIAKQNHYDVELALVKARQDEADRLIRDRIGTSEAWRDEVRHEIQAVKLEQGAIGRKLAYATGTVGAIVVITNFFGPIILRNWGGGG